MERSSVEYSERRVFIRSLFSHPRQQPTRMSSTDQTEDKATEGYTVGDEAAAAAPSGSPDPTTTSTGETDDKLTEAAPTSETEATQAKTDASSIPVSPTPTSTAEAPAAAPAPAEDESSPTEAAPEAEGPVGYLKSMFPEMDSETLEAVLAAHNGSVENAIEALLAMSDPSAVPPQVAQPVSVSAFDPG